MLKDKYDKDTIEKILNESDKTDLLHVKSSRTAFPYINEQKESYLLSTTDETTIIATKSKKWLWKLPNKEKYTLSFAADSKYEEHKDTQLAKEVYEKFKALFESIIQ